MRSQQLQIFAQRFVVGFGGIVFDCGHYRLLIHKAREIVDVAVRVVARDSLLQPDGLANPKIVGEVSLQVRAAESRIPHLHGFAEQALFGGEQQTRAVDIDAAAFEHDARLELRAACRRFATRAGMRLSSRQLSYLAQPLKSQLVMATSPASIANEDRAIVARPASIGGPAEELDGAHVDRAFRENAPDAFFQCGILHQNADLFDARQPPHDIAVDPRNRREFAGPIGTLVRPGQPGGFVRLPFGRHAESEYQRHRPLQSSQRFRMGA